MAFVLLHRAHGWVVYEHGNPSSADGFYEEADARMYILLHGTLKRETHAECGCPKQGHD